MYKKILIAFSILLLAASNAMASENEQNTQSILPVSESNIIAQDMEQDASAKHAAKEKKKKDTADKLNKKLSKKKKLKKADEFKVITDCAERARGNNVAAYVSFTCKNDFTDEHLEVINRILNSGTTVQTLKQVYDFWLTTDEDFSMIEQICALESSYFSEFWYERAYNAITNYEHGALSGEELIEYQSQGVTIEEILAANVMSRKEGQNIYQILDSVIAGVSIEEQAKAIYGVDTLPEYDNAFALVTALAKESKLKNQSALLKATEDEIIEKDEIFDEVVEDMISAELSRLDINESETNSNDDYNALRNTGYPINVLMTLINKGYTPQEIELSAQITEFGVEFDYHKSAKKAREMMKDEK